MDDYEIVDMNNVYTAEELEDLEPVESGLISNLADKFFGFIDKWLTKIGDMGERTGNERTFVVVHNSVFEDLSDEDKANLEKQIESAGSDLSKYPDDYTLIVKIKFIDGEPGKYDTVNVYMKKKGTSDSEGLVQKGVVIDYSDGADSRTQSEEFNSEILKVLDKCEKQFYKEDLNSGFYEGLVPVESAMKLTLKKVTASDEFDIHLVSIDSPYDVDTTNECITQLVDDPDFVDALPENEPATYSIFPEEDEFHVDECEECCVDMSKCISDILAPAYKLYFDCMYLSWNATGLIYQAITNLANTYHWMSGELINKLSEYHYTKCGYAPHPTMFAVDDYCTDCNPIQCLQSDITDLINAIDLLYCNFDGSTQSCLIDMKNNFEHELNYTLARFSG